MQLSGEIEEAAIIQDIPWHKRMLNIIIPIQKSSIMSGYLLPFITCVRELTLFMLLCARRRRLSRRCWIISTRWVCMRFQAAST